MGNSGSSCGQAQAVGYDPLQPAAGAAALPKRCTIADAAYFVDGKEVVLMGGNLSVKAQPYFPDLTIVEKDAKQLAEGAQAMAYTPPPGKDGAPREVKPIVRLSILMEGAMPQPGGAIDQKWADSLESTIESFKEQGVYVMFDIHQDAACCLNGGEGWPWWVADEFQKSPGCCCCPGFSCCFGCGGLSCCRCLQASYITSPEYPLESFVPNCVATCFGINIRTQPEDPNPWLAYSPAPGQPNGNPAFMNIGNVNMRMNNSDSTWQPRLSTTKQGCGISSRVYGSPFSGKDRETFFDAYMALTTFLCRKWEKHWNIIGVGLMNEPNLAGLPNMCSFLSTSNQIFDFFGAVLEELDKLEPPIATPMTVCYWGMTVPGSSILASVMGFSANFSWSAHRRFRSWASKNQLIYDFHYYCPPAAKTFAETIGCAKKVAASLGPGVPIYLSEYYESSPQDFADQLAVACDTGCNCTTYWQYADTEYTGQDGWFKYPPSVTKAGSGKPVNADGVIDPAAWEEYSKTVADGTSWGAYITGSGGAQPWGEVLSLVPKNKLMPSTQQDMLTVAQQWHAHNNNPFKKGGHRHKPHKPA